MNTAIVLILAAQLSHPAEAQKRCFYRCPPPLNSDCVYVCYDRTTPMTFLYQLQRYNDTQYVIRKFNSDYDLLSTYKIAIGKRGGLYCECPQALNRHLGCRHLDMIRKFERESHVNDGAFLCYETGVWHDALPNLA